MNKPEIKYPIDQSDVVAKTNETLLYIKLLTQELSEAYFQLRAIQDWCNHGGSIRNGISTCFQCKKNLKEKEDV